MSIDNHLNDRLEELRIWKTSVATEVKFHIEGRES